MTVLLSRAWTRLPRWLVAVVDQGLVAILNLALSVTVTQVAGVTTLGRFAIVATTTTLCMGVARLLVTDPWLASRSASTTPGSELRWLVASAAVGAAVVTAVVVLIGTGGDRRWLLAVPIAAAVVVQDFGRYLSFRVERTTGAFASDLAVLLGAAVTFGLAAVLGRAGLAAVLVAWLVGLLVGIAVVAGRIAGPTSPAGALAWWRAHCRFLATRLAFDTVAYMIGVSGSLYLLAYVGTPRDVGVVRIVQTMFSPAALVVTGLTMWLVPFLANRAPGQAERVRARATVWLATGSVPLVVLAVLVGPWFARLVFGVDEGPGFVPLALAGISTLAMALAAPWVAAARVSGHYLPIAWSRAASAVATIVGMVILPALRSTSGYLGMVAFQNAAVAAAAVTIGVQAAESRAQDAVVPG
jgi:O-antigen/teichoic acid export membrane protein